MAASAPVRDAPLRVSYVLPPLGSNSENPRRRFFINGDGSAHTLPMLELPARIERRSLNGAQPILRRSNAPSPQVQMGTFENAMRPRHLLPVTALALDTSTPICEPNCGATHTGILYSAGQDGMVCAWDIGKRGEMEHMTRQSVRAHSQWISDIRLCNNNQTLLSASADCTIKTWNPHDPNSFMSPQLLGTHNDYVKAIALADATDCVVSASLDHSVRVWDLREGRHDPLWSVDTRSSLYSVGASHIGTVIAAAGVDRVIHGWDPRILRKSFELVGHLNNVRALSVSDDGRHLLTGSADSTVRLWSVGEQRCIHTFEHHASSVWSLCAPFGDFRTFYSGDRDGNLCKIDATNTGDYSGADCAVIAREYYDDMPASASARGAAIHSIAAIPGAFVWTSNATHSVISRWMDIAAGRIRTDTQPQNRVSLHTAYDPNIPETANDASAFYTRPMLTLSGFHGIMRALILSDRVHALTIDTGGVVAVWNIVRCVCLGTFDSEQVKAMGVSSGLRARESRDSWRPQDTPGDTLEVIQSLVDGQGAIAPWCTLDASNGLLTVHISEKQALSAEMYADDIFTDPLSETPRGWDETTGNVGMWVLRNLASKFIERENQVRTENSNDGMPLILHESASNSLEESVRARMSETEADLPMVSPFGGSQAPETPVRIASPSPLFPGAVTTSALARDVTDMLRASYTANEPQQMPTVASPPKRALLFAFGRRDRDKNESSQEVQHPAKLHANSLRELLRGEINSSPPTDDIPDLQFAYPPTLVISRMQQGSEMQQILYGGASTHTGIHADVIELMAPLWLLRILLAQPKLPEQQDVRLGVFAWRSSRSEESYRFLPDIPASDRLLKSKRTLRIGRVTMYICDCLAQIGHAPPATGTPPGTLPTPPNAPIELLCNGMLLSPYSTLAEVVLYCWKSSGDVRIEYRLKERKYF